jgi:RNA polymerase sigma-70 factor, ECF subfamily
LIVPSDSPAEGPASGLRGPRLTDQPSAGMEEMDWAALVKRCLGGDNAAWTELVQTQHKRVYALCYRFCGSRQDAEDLTQEVFLKVYRNLHTFDVAKGRLQTWLTAIARNLLVDHFRRSRLERLSDSIDAGPEQAPETISSRGPSPHEEAVRKELGRMVQAALVHVPLEFREAVILRDLEELDYKEIAQILRIPEGTVKSRISRGRAELARLLERNKGQVV